MVEKRRSARAPGHERILQPSGREHGNVIRPHLGFYQLPDECLQKPDRLLLRRVVMEYGVRPGRCARHRQVDAGDDGSLDRHLARVAAIREQVFERRRAGLQAALHIRLHVFPIDVLPGIQEQVPAAAVHALPQQQVEHVEVFGSQEILRLVDDEHIPARLRLLAERLRGQSGESRGEELWRILIHGTEPGKQPGVPASR